MTTMKKNIKRHSIDVVSGLCFGHRIEGAKFKRIKARTDQDLRVVVDKEGLVTANYHLGLDYRIRLFKGFSLKVGTRLALWSLAIDFSNHITGEESIKMSYFFLETPLIFQYRFNKKREDLR